MNEAQFKVGSVYRFKAGGEIRLTESVGDGGYARGTLIGCNAAQNGSWSLITGLWQSSDGLRSSSCDWQDLIPGELVLRDGQWVAVEEAKANPDEMTFEELAADLLSPADAAMIARDGPAKPRVTVERWPSLDAMTLTDKPFTSTAKPALSALTLSPDLSEAKHQVNAQHAMAASRSAVGG